MSHAQSYKVVLLWNQKEFYTKTARFRIIVHGIFGRGGRVLDVNEPKKQGPAAPVPD